MNLRPVNPFLPGRPFTQMLDEVFNRSISDMMGVDNASTLPSVNISENGDCFKLELAAPGLDKKDFQISVENGQLTISCSREQQNEEKKEGKWTRKEFSYHSFKRSFSLTDSIDVQNIEAGYEHGILTVKLPKKEEAKAKAPVQINVG